MSNDTTDARFDLVLRLVADADGTIGWHQLDRDLAKRGIVGGDPRGYLTELCDRGLIRASGDTQLPTTRYVVTVAGEARLNRTLR